jgi:hypothetical protein
VTPGKALTAGVQLHVPSEKGGHCRSECFCLAYPQVATKKKAKPPPKESDAGAKATHQRLVSLPVRPSLINARVQKTFDGVVHYGSVMSFDAKLGYYFVRYDDGDNEEYSITELRPLLIEVYCLLFIVYLEGLFVHSYSNSHRTLTQNVS